MVPYGIINLNHYSNISFDKIVQGPMAESLLQGILSNYIVILNMTITQNLIFYLALKGAIRTTRHFICSAGFCWSSIFNWILAICAFIKNPKAPCVISKLLPHINRRAAWDVVVFLVRYAAVFKPLFYSFTADCSILSHHCRIIYFRWWVIQGHGAICSYLCNIYCMGSIKLVYNWFAGKPNNSNLRNNTTQCILKLV